jgi:hypothetical protein
LTRSTAPSCERPPRRRAGAAPRARCARAQHERQHAPSWRPAGPACSERRLRPPCTHAPFAARRCSFHTDPSGTYVKYEAKAIGSGSEGAQAALQEHYRKDLTLAEAEVLALTTLKAVMEEKVGATNVDIARVAPGWHLYTPAEVEAVIARL